MSGMGGGWGVEVEGNSRNNNDNDDDDDDNHELKKGFQIREHTTTINGNWRRRYAEQDKTSYADISNQSHSRKVLYSKS